MSMLGASIMIVGALGLMQSEPAHYHTISYSSVALKLLSAFSGLMLTVMMAGLMGMVLMIMMMLLQSEPAHYHTISYSSVALKLVSAFSGLMLTH